MKRVLLEMSVVLLVVLLLTCGAVFSVLCFMVGDPLSAVLSFCGAVLSLGGGMVLWAAWPVIRSRWS